MIYQWNDKNREHIARHGVKPEEAQEVGERAKRRFPRKIEDEKFLVWGQSVTGRWLQVILVHLPDESVDFGSLSPIERIRFEGGESVGLIIQAREMTADQKRQYRRGKRQ